MSITTNISPLRFTFDKSIYFNSNVSSSFLGIFFSLFWKICEFLCFPIFHTVGDFSFFILFRVDININSLLCACVLCNVNEGNVIYVISVLFTNDKLYIAVFSFFFLSTKVLNNNK